MACQKPLQAQQQNLPSQTKSESPHIIDESRRSAHYKPNIWKYDYLQSLNSVYDGMEYKRRAEKLIEDARIIFVEADDVLSKLQLIDNIKKLGLANHFDVEIKEALATIALINKKNWSLGEEPHSTALCFRLLRQHGYDVSQDMFSGFIDEKIGVFRKSADANIKGILELLEASHLALEGENILEVVRELSTATLNATLPSLESNLSKQVTHALETPSQQRLQWFDVKWQITAYEKDRHMNASLLELAKLNFNTSQATIQKELRELSSWWRNLGVTENLNFARDRLVETFMCSVGFACDPQKKSFRKWLTKVLNLILIIDDVYDIYGTLEELKHFTNAVNRWDVREIQHLPECMKICFVALYDMINEFAEETQMGKGSDQVLPHLKKAVLICSFPVNDVDYDTGYCWTDFCMALLVEVKWFNMGYTPTLQKYLSNAWISSSGSVILVHAFFCIQDEATEEFEAFMLRNQDLLYNLSLIIRLCNDLGTSAAELERGDAPSSILCFMREVNVSEEIARKHIQGMINKAWKKLNGQCLTQLPTLQSLANIVTNVARVALGLYRHGDGLGDQDRETRKNIQSLLVEPLMLN